MDCLWALPLTALTLGLRHGVDWDHIAAISDLVASSPSEDHSTGSLLFDRVKLASMYALGHASAIAVLGVCSMSLHTVLPKWIDPAMNSVIGVTLILLGLCVLYSMIDQIKKKENIQMRSRWLTLWSVLEEKLFRKETSSPGFKTKSRAQSTSVGAIIIGIIHGVSAETATQTLLIAGLGGAANSNLALLMLGAFIAGLLISNGAIALLGASGFLSVLANRTIFVPLSLAAATFSIIVGVFFLTGSSDKLPALAEIF